MTHYEFTSCLFHNHDHANRLGAEGWRLVNVDNGRMHFQREKAPRFMPVEFGPKRECVCDEVPK
jgi:hypothetical protein